MTKFAGWEMPLSFGSIIEEHQAVRHHAGLFDISHMGQLVFRGEDAAMKIERVFSRRVMDLPVGAGRYGLLLTIKGTVVDDIIIYRIAEDEFLAVVNASRIEADFTHIAQFCGQGWFENQSAHWAALALQGPEALRLWQQFSSKAPPARFCIAEFSIGPLTGYVARTGYTGEDGVEIICTPGDVEEVWNTILKFGAHPCGLGARDSLRIEAGYPLYGHELSEELTAFESGAGWAVDFSKDAPWLGADVLRKQKSEGPAKRLVYISTDDKSAIPREGYQLYDKNQIIGTVTSGVFSPTFQKGIGMAIVNSPYFLSHGPYEMEIRGRLTKVNFSKKPHYKNQHI